MPNSGQASQEEEREDAITKVREETGNRVPRARATPRRIMNNSRPMDSTTYMKWENSLKGRNHRTAHKKKWRTCIVLRL